MADRVSLWLRNELGATGRRQEIEAEEILPSDVQFRDALRAASLPVDDLDQSQGTYFRFHDGEGTVGYGGIELYGKNALLRSIAVLEARQKRGHGSAITHLLLRLAEAQGAETGYLLTTDVASFFGMLGFHQVERTAVPEEILTTSQASGLCPSTALILKRSVSL